MRVIVTELLKPITWITILLVLAFLVNYRGKKTAAKRLWFAAVVIGLLFSMGPIPYFLIHHLETRYAPLKPVPAKLMANQKKVDIMVLGGGTTTDDKWPANSQLSYSSLERVVEGMRLFQLLPESRLIFSGNTAKNVESIAETGAKTATSLGIPSAAITILPLPNNTVAEALAYKKYNTDTTRVLILVTDALHMPRAMKCFEKINIHPIAAPTNPIIKTQDHQSGMNWFPSFNTLAACGGALKEYVGAFALNFS